MDQPAGVIGHREAEALTGRPGAAQGRGADWRRSGHQLLSPPNPTSPGPGPSDLRILGAIRPYSGRTAQGLQGEDDGSREEHLRRADLQHGVPQGTWGVQPLQLGKSSTLMSIPVRYVRVYIFGLESDEIDASCVFSTARAPTGVRHRCATRTSAVTRSATLQTCKRRRRLSSTSTSPIRRWEVTTRLPPHLVGRHPRLPCRDVCGRRWGRYLPPRPRPRPWRRRRVRRRVRGSGPGP
jgi:hypothetical protein